MEQRPSLSRTITIPKNSENTTVLSYLCERFTYLSLASWVAQIEAGRVAVNGETPYPETVLRAGDSVSFTPEPYDEPPVNANVSIIFEDDRFLFINKPPLLPCHPGGIYLYNTLWGLLSGRYGYLSFINRLDRETSGIVVAAKTKEAAAYANGLMRERAVDKEYLVFVEGSFPETLDASGILVPDERSPIRKKILFVPDGAECPTVGEGLRCRTLFALMERKGNLSLVRATPLTGRTHQIRATLLSLGYPVTGDKLYGRDETIFLRFIEGTMTDADIELLRIGHQALHCSRISFAKNGGRYDIAAEPPETWRTLMNDSRE